MEGSEIMISNNSIFFKAGMVCWIGWMLIILRKPVFSQNLFIITNLTFECKIKINGFFRLDAKKNQNKSNIDVYPATKKKTLGFNQTITTRSKQQGIWMDIATWRAAIKPPFNTIKKFLSIRNSEKAIHRIEQAQTWNYRTEG
jgi:hypothetical protein